MGTQELDSSVWTLLSSAIWYGPRADECELGPVGDLCPFSLAVGSQTTYPGEAHEALGTYA